MEGLNTETGPRAVIPDVWAERGACPFCGKKSMVVDHNAAAPDALRCTACQGEFQVELGGPRILIQHTPATFPPEADILLERWITIQQVQVVIDRVRESKPAARPISSYRNIPPQEQELIKAPPTIAIQENQSDYRFLDTDGLDQDNLNERALQLLDLGNRDDAIISTLNHAGAASEQVRIAMDVVQKERHKRRAENRTNPTVLFLASAVILLAVIIAGFFLFVYPNLSRRVQQISAMPIDFTGRMPTPTLIPLDQPAQTGYLPEDGATYFQVVWGLSGTYSEKLGKLQAIEPPYALEGIHQTAVDMYQNISNLEAAVMDCNDRQAALGCSEEGSSAPAGDCGAIQAECQALMAEYYAAQQEMGTTWIRTICPVYEQYYKTNRAAYPFLTGRCSNP